MKTFYRKTIASCISLVVLFLTIGPAAAEDNLEIRGPVFNGSNIQEIIGSDGITIDATQFAAFSYDIYDTVSTHTIDLPNVIAGTFEFNGIDVGKGTGEGTYNKNTNRGTITYTGLPISEDSTCLPISEDFTAKYDPITKTLTISMVEFSIIE